MPSLARRGFAAFAGLSLLLVGAALAVRPAAKQTGQPSPAPAAPIRPVTDDYFGVKVVDPYRYLENMKDPEVQAWFKAQNDYTRAILAKLSGHKALLERIKQLDNAAPAKVGSVWRLVNGRYFYLKTLPQDIQPKLYMRDGLTGKETLLVDAEKFMRAGGPPYAINYFTPSDDGRYVAYGVSPGGSENAVLHVLDTTSGRDTGETIDRAQFGDVVAWLPGEHSFLYNRLQKLGPGMPPIARYLDSRVYLHAVGTDAEKDTPILGASLSSAVTIAPTDIPFVVTQTGSGFALALVAHGVRREFTLYDAAVTTLAQGRPEWQKVCDVDDDVTGFAIHGDTLYLLTHKDAPRFKVVRTELSRPDLAHAEAVLPQAEAVVADLSAASDALYARELDGGIGRILRISYAGGQAEPIALPFDGSVDFYPSDPRLPGIVFAATSWVKGPRILAYDPKTGKVTDTDLRPAGPFDNPPDLTSVEVKARSYDGTMVPLSIVYRRGLKLDGSNPAILEGYGAYGITLDPSFDPKRLAWLERGGVFAVAHIRGGGEYGEDWHRWGMKLTKPNTWRDFIACAEYLIEHKYTSPEHLAALGGSAGGITVGRSITERPDLFGAAVIAVGALDMLRFETTPNGAPNVPEFGSVKTRPGFEDLYRMSAYAHVREGTAYPAVLLTTGMNDPRVAPWEPAKMAARLEAATTSGKPILLRVDYEAGHGIGSTKTQQQELIGDIFSFCFWQLRGAGQEH
jgi:prolyl oligopeptidase